MSIVSEAVKNTGVDQSEVAKVIESIADSIRSELPDLSDRLESELARESMAGENQPPLFA